ncbi:Ger(x)C family spore germination protein [Lysinibacillus sp. BPa_S21]|uniref:Ger(x)C family spore germination protein n=1 Tax=Lysinibacillus sp. BPa_S21 TaxID=2932478 RepID=UPI0020133A47|nr:Ger(x)C family spore germination protein [Lysinibacillus sp. BPa_S21]MCL1695100.1 Ger(x)C family spore germination protein [Lysinibacillus sp. BPa_S21]
MKLNYMKGRFKLGLLLSFILLLLTGCWSSKEIEDLGLIVGTSLDLETDTNSREESEEQEARNSNKELITITNQFVTSETTGSGPKEGKKQQAYKNVSETGDAVLPTLRNMILKNDKRAFAEHSKVIVIGEDFASTFNLKQTMDFFLRELEMRPSALLLIAKNHASNILESNEPSKIPAFQLVEMMKGHKKTTKIIPPMTFAKLEGKLYSEASFLLQSVVSENDEIKFVGAAVIEGKTKKLRGFLTGKELEGITWITGKGKGGLVTSFYEETDQPIIYEIISTKSKIIPHVDGENISFNVKIESEGRIAEHWVLSEKTFDNKFLKKAEKATEKEVERLVKNVLDKIQHEYQTDVSGFGTRLRIEYPKVWEKVKKDWDQIFSGVPIQCEVNITIKDYGTSGE